MEILGYIAAILIGLSLGMIGGGGSILTVPVLVYLFKVDPVLATTWSLFIVGVSSLTGGIRSYVKNKVDFKSVYATVLKNWLAADDMAILKKKYDYLKFV